MTKKFLSKNSFFASFFKITFYWFLFSQFHLQIWNKHKILRFLRKKNLDCILKKIFSVKIGQSGYQNAQNFILILNLKMKLRKIKIYLEKLAKGQFLWITFWLSVFFKFCLRIWNQCKILRLLVPILTYLKKKVFSSNFWKIISGLYS